jgi:hypothetical protein
MREVTTAGVVYAAYDNAEKLTSLSGGSKRNFCNGNLLVFSEGETTIARFSRGVHGAIVTNNILHTHVLASDDLSDSDLSRMLDEMTNQAIAEVPPLAQLCS